MLEKDDTHVPALQSAAALLGKVIEATGEAAGHRKFVLAQFKRKYKMVRVVESLLVGRFLGGFVMYFVACCCVCSHDAVVSCDRLCWSGRKYCYGIDFLNARMMCEIPETTANPENLVVAKPSLTYCSSFVSTRIQGMYCDKSLVSFFFSFPHFRGHYF
jgi:hypothetical protein